MKQLSHRQQLMRLLHTSVMDGKITITEKYDILKQLEELYGVKIEHIHCKVRKHTHHYVIVTYRINDWMIEEDKFKFYSGKSITAKEWNDFVDYGVLLEELSDGSYRPYGGW